MVSLLVIVLNMEKQHQVSSRDLLLLSIPVSIIFALSGMDFLGFYTSTADVYTRTLSNVLLGFLFTTIGLFIIPLIVLKKKWKKSLSYFGSHMGNRKLGIIIVLLYLLITPVFYFNSKDITMINTYPLSKEVLSSWSFFVFYELLYIIFYYIPYEFFFRGVLQLGLSKHWNKWYSILFVTALTTALHITKPLPEIAGAVFAGFFLGYIAEKTQSWFYVFLIHITTGVFTDVFCSLYYTGVL